MDKLYQFVMSLPFPEKWLLNALKDYETEDMEAFLKRDYIQNIVTDMSEKLGRMSKIYDGMLAVCMEADGPKAIYHFWKRSGNRY